MGFLKRLLAESAAKWDVSFTTARLLFWIPVLLTAIVLTMAVIIITSNVESVRNVYRYLLQEDGPAEWLSAVSLAIGGVLALLIASHRRRVNLRGQALLFLIGGVLLLFAAAEEISWGQRIFGWETPEALIEINDQNEISLHNIGFMLQVTNIAMLLAGLFGAAAYLVNKRVRIERFWPGADFLLIPPFFLFTFFVFIFLFRVARLTLITESSFVITRISEWVETLLAIGILIFLRLAYRYAKLVPSPTDQVTSEIEDSP